MTRTLGATGLAVSELCIGTSPLASMPNLYGYAVGEDRAIATVDAVLDSGVTQEFLLRRLGESRPRSIRLAVLLDKPRKRRVALEPDYFGFRTASNQVWVGYGLAAANGTGRNLRQLSSGANGSLRKSAKGRKK